MTNLEKLAEKKALELLNEVQTERGNPTWTSLKRECHECEEAIYRAVLAHETFKREVSDAVEALFNNAEESGTNIVLVWADKVPAVKRFILPKPVDPLVEAAQIIQNWRDGNAGEDDALDTAKLVVEKLAARGINIPEAGQ